MSAGRPIPLEEAQALAERVVELLAPACERIAIAGSIRRRRDVVHDIEIVAIAREEERAGLWGGVGRMDLLEATVRELLEAGVFALRDVRRHKSAREPEAHRNGRSYKALVCRDIPLDLFIVRPPAQWGVIFALRTGPGDWNRRLVTECQRLWRRVENGQVWHGGQVIPTPEEEDFFRALGQPWVPPEERSPERVAIGAPEVV